MEYHAQPKPVQSSSSDILQADAPVRSAYKDVVWALLFLANVALVCVGAVMNFNKIDLGTGPKSSPETNLVGASFIAGILGSIVFAIFWIRYLCRESVAANIIKIAMAANAAMLVVGVIVSFATGQVMTGVIMLLVCGVTLLWYFIVRNRIAFTGVMLEMAATCTREFGSTVYIAIVMQVVTLGWFILWIIAIMGVAASDNSVVQVLLALSLIWTWNVLMNVVHVGVGGVAATWFYQSQTSGVVSSSFKRASTTSLGSICLGSLIVSVIEIIRTTASNAARRTDNFIVVCIVECILGLIQAIAEFITKYAYAYVAVWGQGFCEAAKNTWSLLKSRGFDVIVNDDLSRLAFWVSTLPGGIVSSIVGGLVFLGFGGKLSSPNLFPVMLGCFFLGAALTGVAMSVLESCVVTFMVLWCEDPVPLARNHPTLHQKLVAAVRKMYPNFRGSI